ncbi:Aste57867_7697 [Aphanomyces stellatus]|uniref:Aste57867_7697 protein n=1 Tax=Aphanomyces stellatus TaxID=120398 RepID=A0A485KIN1_9STRA|nr:hypothetical protein As57867_007668 [Aphanomyces stellatus]VFT84600.1 Aste57867_7697 [Aphanomyces stellatus]
MAPCTSKRYCDTQMARTLCTAKTRAPSTFPFLTPCEFGQSWLESTLDMTWLSDADELAVWHAAGIMFWQSELTNGLQEETITIENALGLATTLTINSVDESHGMDDWESIRWARQRSNVLLPRFQLVYYAVQPY